MIGKDGEGERPREPFTTAFTRRKPARGVRIIQGQPTIVFVTVHLRGCDPCLSTPEAHAALTEIWHDDATRWLVGRYVLMPNHIHLFAALNDDDCPLENWVRYWKRRFTQRCGLAPGSFQDGMWDTRMRSARQYEEKWEYVYCNPVRHGFVSEPDRWPYAGEIYELRW